LKKGPGENMNATLERSCIGKIRTKKEHISAYLDEDEVLYSHYRITANALSEQEK